MRGLWREIAAVRPATKAELLAALASDSSAALIAGGTDVMVRLEAGAPVPQAFIDMSGLESELRTIRVTDAFVEFGALATYRDTRTHPEANAGGVLAAEFPLIEEAARTVGAAQIQGRGTWAGNVANGSPAADGVAALLAYDAVVVLESKAMGPREAPLHGFFTGYKKMDLRAGEFIAAVRLPRRGPDLRHVFHKIGTRRAQAITKVGIIATRRADRTHRIVGTSVAPFVARYPGIEALLDSTDGTPTPAALRAAVRAEVHPIDDIRSTAGYRLEVIMRLIGSFVQA